MSITHTGERIFANDAKEGEAVRSVLLIPQEQVVDSTGNAERNRSAGGDGRGGGQSEALPDGSMRFRSTVNANHRGYMR